MMMGMRGGPHAGQGGAPVRARQEKALVTIGRIAKGMHADLVALIFALVFGCVSVGLSVSGPYILGHATNLIFDGFIGQQLPAHISKAAILAGLRARGEGNFATLLSGLSVTPGVGVNLNALRDTVELALGVYLGGALFSFFQTYIMAGVAQRTVFGLRRQVEEKLAKLPLAYFDSHPHGDIMSRVTNDIDNIATTIQQGLGQLLTSLLTIVGVVIMMIIISPLLALVALVTIPLAFFAMARIANLSQVQFGRQWQRTGALNGHVEGTHTGHDLVALFGQRDAAIKRFDEYNEALYDASFRAQFLSGIIQPTMQLLSNLNYVIVAAVGGWRIASGALSLGAVTAFIQYSRQFTQPLTQIASQMNLLQSGLASAERVYEFLDADNEATLDSTANLPTPLRGRVAIENIHFRYTADTPLIDGFSLEVEPGHTIAIVGPTGAGKTTLVNLLMRFYEIHEGDIRLDGVPYSHLSRDAVRAAFGMVLQDTWLFGGTIRDNIAYGKKGATHEQIMGAAVAARADHFIRTLPDGYDTIVEGDGGNLSAGQKQLLTIARAFLADPTILILDEATSSVDSRTEMLIQEAMADLRGGRTSFVIAHRLSTIRNAHTIVVMEHGSIVEQGNHEDLMEKGGAYATLHHSQFLGGTP